MVIKLLLRHWVAAISIMLGIYTFLPFLAPVLMHIGWSGGGRVIYFIYSWFCHQLPERSFFLFGSHFTYSLKEIQVAWSQTTNPAILRQFIGNPDMGWKVAWSDRMVSMFVSLWIFGLLAWPFRSRLKQLPWWGLLLFLLPMAVDGTSHLFSDLAGIGQGFRDTNQWLAMITGHVFPASVYAGDGWGSFNSLMRLLTGIMFGIGIVWYTYPNLGRIFTSPNESLKVRDNRAQAKRPEYYLYERKN